MKTQELELQVLFKELEHADSQISGYLDWQVKILGLVVTLFAGGLGILFSGKSPIPVEPEASARLLVILSVIGSLGVIQSVVYYGISLGYIYNKVGSIAPRIQALLNLDEPPLRAVQSFREGPARLATLLSTVAMMFGIFCLNCVILVNAWVKSQPASDTKIWVVVAAGLLGFSVVSQVLVAIAFKKIERTA